MTWLKTNESKGMFLSLLIHSTLLTALLMSNDKPIKLADKEKTISIDLMSYQPPKPIKKPKEVVKQEPKPKPIKKPEPKHKPIIKKKPEPKPEPIKEEIKEPITPEPIEPKKIEKPQNTKKNIQKQQQAFVKTNFAIIRDMVLSNLRYPNIAKRMGWQGIVEVKLVISKSGELLEYSIFKSSGKRHLDQAALKAVESITKEDLPKPNSTTTILLPIGFKLQ
ncbi:MAG: energy transducer TonB [Arcobacteraceae bacterium]|nr:energy transducer TonB [Arcobacteraceae bacterium]